METGWFRVLDLKSGGLVMVFGGIKDPSGPNLVEQPLP